MLCIRPDASVAQWPVRKQRRWRYAQCRELLLSCLTQLAEGSNLVQAVSVGCCRCGHGKPASRTMSQMVSRGLQVAPLALLLIYDQTTRPSAMVAMGPAVAHV